MKTNALRKPASVKQRGLSLVELMISLAIASMVTLGMIQMFTANQESADMLRGQAQLGESGRFAMEMMARVAKSGRFASKGTTISRLPT